MNTRLQLLIDLQHIDLKIFGLDEEMFKIPQQIEELQKGSDEQKLEYEAKLQAAENIEKAKRKKERDLEVKESDLSKLKNQLLSVKTNREYQALLHEIESAKAEISRLEEEILLLIEDSDMAKEQIKKAKFELKESGEQINNQKQEKEKELERLVQEKQGFESQKETIQQQIPKELLKKYNKIKDYRDGLAVVPVKEGSCQGCFMSLMPQLFQEVRKNTEIYYCPHCHRIIYFKE